MAAKPRQLSLDELLRLKWLLGGATALVALWTVFFLDIEALGLVAIASAVIVAVLVWPRLPARVPVLGWRLAVPAIIAAFVADLHFSPDTLPALIRLAMLLVLYRAAAYRRKREDLQLLVLGLFLIVVAGVLTVAIEFAFLLLLFTACALGFLFVINLVDAAGTGAVRTAEAETAWTRLGWRPFLARLRAVADWRLLAFGTVLFATVVAMSGLLFLIIPRFELASGFFLDRYITRKSRSGFTDTVRFGDVTELAKDESVAMRVDLTDASGVRENPYWRLVVLDEYTPEGFKVSAGLKAELMRGERMAQVVRGRSLGRRAESAGGTWTFYVEPGVSRYLPLPGSFGLLRLRDPLPVQTSPASRMVALRTEPMTMTAYQLEEVDLDSDLTDARLPQLLQQARAAPEQPASRFRQDPGLTLRGPTGPRNEAVLRRLVDEITGGRALSAEEFAPRATAWLHARHAYSLSVHIPRGEGDDIVRWIDSNEPGFCEYFAAGFTVLARAAGHPARVVAGFHGGTLNAFENYFMVKNTEAHAWAEIHDGRNRWLRVDPTPGNSGTLAQGAAQAVRQEQDSSWSARLDSLRVLWYRRIVNFDSRQQVRMIEQVKSFSAGSGAALRAWLDETARKLRAWLARPWDLARLVRLAGLATGVVALAWFASRLAQAGWRRWRHRGRPGCDAVRQEAGRQLARLRELTADRRTDAGEVAGVMGDLRRLRYGRRETWPEPRGVFRRAKAVRRAVRR
ncbi:MAG: transglutaminaseTgpA domain-containing protein [Verrucomicrobiota bacterium]